MKTKVGILFDLDGVLVDSEEKYTEIWTTIDRLYPTGIENFADKIKGTTLENILGKYYPDHDIRTLVEKELYAREAEMTYGYAKGAASLLQRLRERNIPDAIVTSSNGLKMEHLWRDIPEMKDLFTAIVTGDHVTKSKPDPQGYQLGAELIGVPTTNCAVFEDSLQGVIAGRSAGCFVVGVAGTMPAEVLAPYCDKVIENLEYVDLDNLLTTLASR